MLQGISDQLKNYIQPTSFNQTNLGNSNLEINLSDNYDNTSTFQESTLGCQGISFQYNADNKVQGAACLVRPTPENPSNPGNQCNTVSCLMQSILNKISNGGTETGGKDTNTCTGQNKGCLELKTDANGGYSLISLEDISGAPIPTQTAQVQLKFTQNYSIEGVLNEILKILNYLGDLNNGDISGYLVNDNNTEPSNCFRVNIQASRSNSGENAVVFTVTTCDNYENSETAMTEPTDGTSVGPGDQNPTNHTDSFLAANPPKADFLFVINNSYTMQDEINYVKDNITTFVNRLNTFNIDFMAGTIMTDSSKLRGLDMPNPRSDSTYGFTNDIAKIQLDVQVGAGGGTSSGSYHDSNYYAYESCVYFAEKALSSTNPDPNNTISGKPNLGNGLGDIGSVLSEGYPRSGASLTIICVTDDDDIYTHWDNTNCPDSNCSTTQPDGNAIDVPEFDVNNNLFVQNNYKFYFIMPLTSTGEKGDCSGPGSSSGTNYYADDFDGLSGSLQYDDSRRVDMIALANKTGGGYSSICSANYGAYLSKIVDDIASNASTYTLTYIPVSSTIRVFINGTEIPKTANPGTGQTGYIYDSSTNKISFTGTLPAAGSSIQVSYFHY